MRLLYFILPIMTMWSARSCSAQLVCGGTEIFLGPNNTVEGLDISDKNGAHVTFKYTGAVVDQSTPDFLVVIPSSGTTPATVYVTVNPNVVPLMFRSTTYNSGVEFSTTQNAAPSSCGAPVTFRTPAQRTPTVQSVVNAASLQPVLSPGALVSILGSNLFATTLSTQYNDTGFYPTNLGGTGVYFNNVPAPLLYVSPNQINAIVPFSLSGQTSVKVAVSSPVDTSVTVPLQDTAPAIFTATQTGTGQAAVQQQSLVAGPSYNSSSNPAHAGDYVTFFATGQGLWNPPPFADVFVGIAPTLTHTLSVTIGGQTAKVVYAGLGGAGPPSASVLQVNAVVPSGLAPGPQPLVLSIGANNNSQQDVVIYVQ